MSRSRLLGSAVSAGILSTLVAAAQAHPGHGTPQPVLDNPVQAFLASTLHWLTEPEHVVLLALGLVGATLLGRLFARWGR